MHLITEFKQKYESGLFIDYDFFDELVIKLFIENKYKYNEIKRTLNITNTIFLDFYILKYFMYINVKEIEFTIPNTSYDEMKLSKIQGDHTIYIDNLRLVTDRFIHNKWEIVCELFDDIIKLEDKPYFKTWMSKLISEFLDHEIIVCGHFIMQAIILEFKLPKDALIQFISRSTDIEFIKRYNLLNKVKNTKKLFKMIMEHENDKLLEYIYTDCNIKLQYNVNELGKYNFKMLKIIDKYEKIINLDLIQKYVDEYPLYINYLIEYNYEFINEFYDEFDSLLFIDNFTEDIMNKFKYMTRILIYKDLTLLESKLDLINKIAKDRKIYIVFDESIILEIPKSGNTQLYGFIDESMFLHGNTKEIIYTNIKYIKHNCPNIKYDFAPVLSSIKEKDLENLEEYFQYVFNNVNIDMTKKIEFNSALVDVNLNKKIIEALTKLGKQELISYF